MARGLLDRARAADSRLSGTLPFTPQVVNIMRAFGILHTKDTPIGDSMLR